MALLKQRMFRRLVLAWIAAAGLAPSSALALMPWRGVGVCTAMDAPCVRLFETDFRDYSPLAVTNAGANSASDAPEPDESLTYDWSAAEGCGPTDWDCSRRQEPSPGSVSNAAAAVVNLLPIPSSDFVDWDAMGAAFQATARYGEISQADSQSAQASVGAGLNASARALAGQLSGALDVVGRGCLGAAASLERFAAPRGEAQADARAADTRVFLGL